MHFEANILYRANDPRVTEIIPYSTLASYRHEGRGPAYLKVGTRIFYQGAALNEWLKTLTVEPKTA